MIVFLFIYLMPAVATVSVVTCGSLRALLKLFGEADLGSLTQSDGHLTSFRGEGLAVTGRSGEASARVLSYDVLYQVWSHGSFFLPNFFSSLLTYQVLCGFVGVVLSSMKGCAWKLLNHYIHRRICHSFKTIIQRISF